MHLNPAYMQSVFTFKENQRFDLRSGDTLMRNRIQTTKFGLQSVSHIGAQLWDSLPSQVKSANSSKEFSGLLKALPVLKCKCRLCADYIQNLGFLWFYQTRFRGLLKSILASLKRLQLSLLKCLFLWEMRVSSGKLYSQIHFYPVAYIIFFCLLLSPFYFIFLALVNCFYRL